MSIYGNQTKKQLRIKELFSTHNEYQRTYSGIEKHQVRKKQNPEKQHKSQTQKMHDSHPTKKCQIEELELNNPQNQILRTQTSQTPTPNSNNRKRTNILQQNCT